MVWERIAHGRRDVDTIDSVDYYVGKNETALKINKVKYLGSYPALGAAREVVNGFLLKAGCSNPWGMGFRLNETITYLDTYTTQNTQTGNSVGTFFTTVAPATASTGIVDLTDPSYIKLLTSTDGTQHSRARLINENDAFGVLDPTIWSCRNNKSSRYRARVQLDTFNLANWNSNGAYFGFCGAHNGTSFTGEGLSVEKGCVFRTNSLGNWRCSWYVQTTSASAELFKEQAFIDTNISAFSPTDLSVIIDNFGEDATWLINNKPVFYVNSSSYKLVTSVGDVVRSVIFSQNSYGSLEENVDNGFKSYIGCELRRRTAGSAQDSIRIYNTTFDTIVS